MVHGANSNDTIHITRSTNSTRITATRLKIGPTKNKRTRIAGFAKHLYPRSCVTNQLATLLKLVLRCFTQNSLRVAN